jgi:putative inorganic carbon (HCO3(-)) transporter
MLARTIALYLILGIILLTPIVFTSITAQTFEINKVGLFCILTTLVFIFSIISLFQSSKINRGVLTSNKYILSLIFIFLICFCLSSFFSVSPWISFWGSYARHQGLYTYLHYFSLFISVLLLQITRSDLQKIGFTVILAATLVSIYGILQFFNLDFLIATNPDEFLGRVFSTFGHPNFLGQYLIFTIPITLSFGLFFPTAKIKYLISFSFFLQFITLIFTLNRASILGITIGLFFFLIIYTHLNKKTITNRILLGLLMIIIFLPISINFLPPKWGINQLPLLNRLDIKEENLRSISSRLAIFPGVIELISQNPLGGWGPETLAYTYPRVMNQHLYLTELFYQIPDRAHNEILDTAYNLGIFGTIVLICIYLWVIIRGIKYYFLQKPDSIIALGISTAFLGAFIANQFSFPLTVHLLYFFFFLAILVTITNKPQPQSCPFHFSWLILLGVFPLVIINIYFNIQTLRADFYLKSAQTYIPKNDLPSIILHLEKAVAINPISNEYKYFLANFYQKTMAKENFEKGLSLLNIAENRNNFASEGYLLKGKLYAKLAKLELSNTAYQKALDLAPIDPKILRDWGDMLYNQKQFQLAIDKYEQLLQISPPYWQWTETNLAQKTEYEQRKHRLFFKHNPQFKQVFFFLSQAYHQIGETDKANWYWQYIK